MCGIAGFATNRTEGLSPDMLRIARDGLAHRGPDDFGFFCMRGGDRRLTRDVREFLPGTRRLLVHRRLSILDLSAAGWQPMATDDGRYLLTFNGEIYNYVELRGELEKQGYHFVSQSDTEVLLKGYVAWGPEVLDRLIGMFAFAILDTQNEELFLARDFFGIKPLYYATTADCFGFASDLGVLTEAMGLPRRPDPENLYLFMRFGITDHGNRTLFEAVRQLPSAHWLNVNLRTMSQSGPVRYWRPDLERSRDVSYDQATASVREIFLENIRLHMRSDVPIGVALSGGLDSSAILMSMRHVAGRTQRLIAFSFVPDDPKLSEEKWIDLVSAASGAEVHKVHVSPSDIVAEFEDLTATHCLPISQAPSGRVTLHARSLTSSVSIPPQPAVVSATSAKHLVTYTRRASRMRDLRASRVTIADRGQVTKAPSSDGGDRQHTHRYRLSWAQALAKVFEIDLAAVVAGHRA